MIKYPTCYCNCSETELRSFIKSIYCRRCVRGSRGTQKQQPVKYMSARGLLSGIKPAEHSDVSRWASVDSKLNWALRMLWGHERNHQQAVWEPGSVLLYAAAFWASFSSFFFFNQFVVLTLIKSFRPYTTLHTVVLIKISRHLEILR